MTTRLQHILDWLTVWVCGTCMGLLAGDVIIGAYNAGLSPIKPSLFTPVVLVLCLGVAALSRPKLCLPALMLTTLPAMRLLDVGVLKRFDFPGSDDMTMSCLRILFVVASILAVLSCRKGIQAMRWAAILAIILTSGSCVAEFLGLATFSSIPGRAAGFNGHPNSPPIILCQCLGICFATVPSFRWNAALIAVALPGVALTFGRSGMVIYAFIAGLYLLMNARKNMGFLLICAAALFPLLITGFALLQQSTNKGIQHDENTTARLDAIYNLDFEKLKSPERAQDLMDAWEGLMQRPLTGYGVGSASAHWAPHNEYVAMWLEMGVLGLIVYLATLYVPAAFSAMSGGRAGYAIIALLLYSPIAQDRVMDPHFYVTLMTVAHLLWPQRFRFALHSPVAPSPDSQSSHRHAARPWSWARLSASSASRSDS